ncbi:MAG TPA: outer membrane beta-barrel protein [Paludibacteraceae bacterium]|nr:outer membrane beta-barrel protein [Paludibacteraceae bacterium]
MKRIVCIVILLVSISCLVSGQKFSAGAKAGLNIIPLEKQDLKGNLFSPGYHFGAVGSYKINDWFSLSLEVIYTSQKKIYEKFDTTSFIETLAANPLLSIIGVDINDLLDTLGMVTDYINDDVYNTTRAVVNLAYIKIPVLANFNYKSLYISAGPYVSFLVSNKTTEEYRQHLPLIESFTGLDTIPFFSSIISTSFPGCYEPVTTKIEKDKNIRKVDFGVMAEISYRLNNNFTVGVSYHQGLLNYRSPEIYKKDYLSSINFSIGYLFNLKKNGNSMY